MGFRAFIVFSLVLTSVSASQTETPPFASFVRKIDLADDLIFNRKRSPCACYSYLLGELYDLNRSSGTPKDFLDSALFWLSDYNYIRSQLSKAEDEFRKGKIYGLPLEVSLTKISTPLSLSKRMQKIQILSGQFVLLPAWIGKHAGAQAFGQGAAGGYIQMSNDSDTTGRHDHFIMNAIAQVSLQQAYRFTEKIRKITVGALDNQGHPWKARGFRLLSSVPSYALKHSKPILKFVGREVERRQAKGTSETDLIVNARSLDFADWLLANHGKLEGSAVNEWVFAHLCDESKSQWTEKGVIKSLTP